MPPAELTDEQLKDIFSYHNDPNAIPKYEAVRNAAFEFAKVIRDNCPISPDKSVAYRKLRECVMSANASIALEGRY